MFRRFLAFLLLAAGLLIAAPAWASGDDGCSVNWKLHLSTLNDCNNQPFLSPGNDSRVNLQLMLLDAGKAQFHTVAPSRSQTDRSVYPSLVGASPFTLDDLNNRIVPPPPGADPNLSDRADGEGSRCNSNGTGADQFAAALAASTTVPANERAALLAGRRALKPSCADDPKTPVAPPPPVAVQSAVGKQFAAYLAGAAAFYDGRFDAATQSFGALQASSQSWLKETARYMLGRVALNRAQAGAFGEYGAMDLSKVSAKDLATAKAGFDAYLRDYPAGAYAASARGLLRRVDWLGGRTSDLASDFARAFDAPGPPARNVTVVDLAQEADAKLLSGADFDIRAIRDPLLLAAFDLMHMRSADPKLDPKLVTSAALEAQRPAFAGHEALFDYLRAAHAFYDDKTPAAALAILPTTAPRSAMTYLQLSQQVLRALALEETGDHAGARKLWLALMPVARPPLQHSTLELGLAMNYERGAALGQVYAAGSPIADADLRELLLKYAAGPALLRQQAKAAGAPEHERRLALYVLLYKQMTRGQYQAFLGDLPLMPPAPPKAVGDNPTAPDPDFAPFRWDGKTDEGYVCPALPQIARDLARDPRNPASLVCLDEFVRTSNFDDDYLDAKLPADELGGAPSQFPGGPYSRLESYKAMLADAKTPGPVRAYVLYRAVQCYAPSGYDHCGGKDVPKTQRKAWFTTLKADYPASTWAKSLKYYW